MLNMFSDRTPKKDVERFPLHKAAFEDNLKDLKDLLASDKIKEAIDELDCHGNCALHIATMLGHKAVVLDLLENGATVNIQNKEGWSSLAEAVSFGNREIISAMLEARKSQNSDLLASRKPYLIKMLTNLNDFYLELKWDFETWIPLLSKILPSDTCKIYKRGSQLRMDSTLVDFNNYSWQRGDISFLFSPQNEAQQFVLMDNKKRVYQKIQNFDKTSANEFQKELEEMMSQDVMSLNCSTKTISFTPAMTGWLFKHEKFEEVGDFTGVCYVVDGLRVVSRKRREHLSAEDVKRNKELMQALSANNTEKMLEIPSDAPKRKSLPPPPRPNLTWNEYLSATSPPKIGRPHVEKKSVKEFKPVIAMSESFPLSVEIFVDILEIVAPFKQFEKLRKFCMAKMPPGFPVKLEIPLIATVSAKVTFEKFEWREKLTPEFFSIPDDYREDARRFKDLH